jgi:hypothetical protein
MSHAETGVEPVPVTVVNHPTPSRYSCRSSFRTIVLTATNPYAQLAGADPLRKCVRISGVQNPIVIGNSISQASDPNNLAAAIANPNGRYIPGGAALQAMEWIVEGGDNEIWFSAGVYPTIIGCEIVREVPES